MTRTRTNAFARTVACRGVEVGCYGIEVGDGVEVG